MEAVERQQGWKVMIIIPYCLLTIKKCNRVYDKRDRRAVERRLKGTEESEKD